MRAALARHDGGDIVIDGFFTVPAPRLRPVPQGLGRQ